MVDRWTDRHSRDVLFYVDQPTTRTQLFVGPGNEAAVGGLGGSCQLLPLVLHKDHRGVGRRQDPRTSRLFDKHGTKGS